MSEELPHRYHVMLFHRDWDAPRCQSFEEQESVADWIGELGDRSDEFFNDLVVKVFYGREIPIRFSKTALVVSVDEEKYLVEKRD